MASSRSVAEKGIIWFCVTSFDFDFFWGGGGISCPFDAKISKLVNLILKWKVTEQVL